MSLCRGGGLWACAHPRVHITTRAAHQGALSVGARHGPPCPKKREEMTLEGVRCESGSYDNTRSV